MAMSLIQACCSLALSTWLLSFCFVHLLCLDFTVAEKEEWYTAFVNITYAEPAPDPGAGAAGGGGAELHTEKTECGRYGEHSPKQDARGEVVMASSAHDRLACDPNTKFAAPTHGKNWIALIPKGNCTYRDKIRNAFLQNASAVVIFNVGSNTNETITMPHAGVEDIVAIMIPEPKGKEIVSLLERNITVTMYITIGTRNLQKYRRLGDAAKKAISKLQIRTIKKGDKETESDFDNCAVCIEGYKPNDVVRILPCRHLFHKSCVDPWLLDHRTCPMCKMNILKALGIPPNADCMDDLPTDFEGSLGGPPTNQITGASDTTVNESSVTLDPAVRTVGALQVVQDTDPIPQEGDVIFTTNNEWLRRQWVEEAGTAAQLASVHSCSLISFWDSYTQRTLSPNIMVLCSQNAVMQYSPGSYTDFSVNFNNNSYDSMLFKPKYYAEINIEKKN
ncbi:RING finger protein 150 isoform X2 [Pan paniscus]|uniref:RING finger protein 150 isoform X2 n=1 Tax=Pan paniscus TaxID=9597 RepID=UPI00155F68EA|nr:RING finger protein 150 isoform X2 [Pan paniscus]